MRRTILPGAIGGEIVAVASKSHLHRLLIGAALSEGETRIRHGALCEDIDATCRCLTALGASIKREPGCICVRGIGQCRPAFAELDCGESG
ncbi:MAG: 3-phosphoshikimate 1-carboxyvinyltransferase, partial [Clostridia bacterium]|nr:3-phosphoshikimate 1-carboxyvinyltransferase [Clostridia bacterium]